VADGDDGVASGCGRWDHDVKIIDKGIDHVAKHAAAIDEAAKGGNRPTPESNPADKGRIMNRSFFLALSLALAGAFALASAQDRPRTQEAKTSKAVADAVSRGRLQRNQQDYDAAKATFEEALATCRAANDRAGEVLLLNNLASVYRYRAGLTRIIDTPAKHKDSVDKAVELYDQALKLARDANDVSNEAYASLYLGVLAASRNDADNAITHFDDALKLYKSINDPEYIGRTYMSLGQNALDRQKQPEAALKHYEQALPKFREIGYWPGIQSLLDDMKRACEQLMARRERKVETL
jgi:tetratricopeptide (TPR) repeat protein